MNVSVERGGVKGGCTRKGALLIVVQGASCLGGVKGLRVPNVFLRDVRATKYVTPNSNHSSSFRL